MGEILFLAHRVPFPPNRGDKIRSAHLLKKLAQFGPVHVGCFSENNEDESGVDEVRTLARSQCIVSRSKPLMLAGVEAVLSGKPVSLTAFHSDRLARWVRDTIDQRNIATIVVFSGQMGQYIPDSFAGRVIVDLCDVDSAKFQGYADAGQRPWLNTREARLLKAEEERLGSRADATTLISENEAELYRSRLCAPSKVNIEVLGNGIDTQMFDPAKIEAQPGIASQPGPHFVFTGQMDYPPNVDAVRFAADEFMPSIRATHREAQLHIVGRNPSRAVSMLDELAGVRVWGAVPDMRFFIAAADCVLAPLMIARGVQNKVLEAMAMARPILLSPGAATGIDAHDGEHWLICENDAQAMCERVQPVLCDAEFARKLGTAARHFVLEHNGWDAKLAPLEALVTGKGEEVRNAA
jgi:sugar transferase (PEP-CTERM/EpsH1 system associated)